jgi:hypothetical protein
MIELNDVHRLTAGGFHRMVESGGLDESAHTG